jgi:hypothetical protein
MPEQTSAQQQQMLAQHSVIRISGFMDVTLTEDAKPRKFQIRAGFEYRRSINNKK